MSYYPPNTNLRFIKTTREEEKELFRKMKEGDDAARETIIKHHLLFVAIVARHCAAGKFPDDDVVSAANETLIQVLDRKQFEPERGHRFTSYIRPFIRWAIIRMWRESNKYVGIDNHTLDTTQTAPLVETTEDHSTEETDFQEFLLKTLESGKDGLSERERLVLSLMYEQGFNMAQVGRRLKMTRERIRQVHEEILGKLRKTMLKSGLNHR